NLTLEVAGFRFSYTPLAADAVAGTAGTYHVRYGYHEFTVANRAEAQTYARMALRLSQGDDVWTNPNYGRAYHVLGYLGEDDVLPAAQAGQTITLSLDDLVGMVTGPLGPVVRRGVAGSRLIEVQRVAVAALISEHNVESDAPASPPVPNSVAEADGLMERGRRVLFNSPAITETPAHQANRLFRQAYESDPSPQRAITIIGYYLDRRRSPVSNVEGVRKRTLIFFLQWLTPSDITDENRALVERALTRVHASSDLRAQILGREGSVAAVEEAAAPVPEEPVAVVSTSTQPEPVEAPAGREAVGAERIAASMQRIVQERILTHGRTDSDSNGVLAGEERATLSDSENAALITAREEVGRSRAGVQRSLAWLGRLQTRAEEARATTLVSRINRYIDDGRALLEHINAAQEAENANQVRTAYSATAEARQEFLGIDIAGLESEVVGAERDAVAVAERRRVSAGATVTDTSEVPPEEEVERNSPQAHTASLLVAPRNIRQQAETQFTSRLLEQARNHSITISRRVVYTGTYDPVTGAVVLRYNYPGPRNGISALETYVRTISFTVSSDSTLTGRCRISFSYIPQ
ncbi:hypothetical protein COT42_08110, partial [Candidatus Saganbacteria bacterium CG08_land_8_20_14_0_20_45_16]